MKCLVTGASGFIGQHLVKALEKRGDEVVKLSLRAQSDLLGLPELDTEVIYHLASYGNMSNQKNVNEIFETNLVKTYSLLQAANDIPYKAFINVSSSSVLLPHETMYSATKAGAERLCKAFVDEYGKPIVTVRPYSVYGPGEADFRFIPTVFRSCLRGEPMALDPHAVHDWVYIDDLVATMISIADMADELKGAGVNVGTGYGTTNEQMVEFIEILTGKKANITERKTLRNFDNGDWIMKTLNSGFVSIPEVLGKCYEYYRAKYA